MQFYRHILRKDFDLYTCNENKTAGSSYLTATGSMVEEISCDSLRSRPKYTESGSETIKWLFRLNSFEFITITDRTIKMVKNGQVVVDIPNKKVISDACYENSLFLLFTDNTLDVYSLQEMKGDGYKNSRLYKVTSFKPPFEAKGVVAVPFYISKVLLINKNNNLLLFDIFKESIVETYEELDMSGVNKISASPLLDVITIEKDNSILFYHLINKKTINEISFDFEHEKMIKLAIDIQSLSLFLVTSMNNLLIFNLESREVIQKTSLSKITDEDRYQPSDIIIKIQNTAENKIIIQNSKLNTIHLLTYNKSKDFYETTVHLKGINKEDNASIFSLRYGTKFIFNENEKIYLTKLEDDTLRTEISFNNLNKRLNLTGVRMNTKQPRFNHVVFSDSPGLKSRYCAVHNRNTSFYIIDLLNKRAMPFLMTISNDKGKITTLSFAPDSNKVFVGTSNGGLEIYRVETGIKEKSGFNIDNKSPVLSIVFNATTIDLTIITMDSIYKLKKTGFSYSVIVSKKINGGETKKVLISQCKRILGLVGNNNKKLRISVNWNLEDIREYSFDNGIKEAKFLFQFFVLIVSDKNEVLIYDLLLKKKVLFFKFEKTIKFVETADHGRRLFCRFIGKPGMFCYKIDIENVCIDSVSFDKPILMGVYGQHKEKTHTVNDKNVGNKISPGIVDEAKHFASLLNALNIKREQPEFVEINKDTLDGIENTSLLEKYQKKFFVFSFVKGTIDESVFLTKYNTANKKRIETEFFYLWFAKISVEKVLEVLGSLFVKDTIDLTKMNVKMALITDALKFYRKDILKEPVYRETVKDILNQIKEPLENIKNDNLYISGNLNSVIEKMY